MESAKFVAVFLILCSSALIRVDSRSLRHKRQVDDLQMLFLQICQIGDDTYKHPFACGKYLECDKGNYVERDCPPNMNYDVVIKACEFRFRLKCQLDADGVTEYIDLRKNGKGKNNFQEQFDKPKTSTDASKDKE